MDGAEVGLGIDLITEPIEMTSLKSMKLWGSSPDESEDSMPVEWL